MYVKNLKLNPGSTAINPPGPKPSLGHGIEGVRAWIRAFTCVKETTLRLDRSVWSDIFQTGSSAIAQARSTRDMYNTQISGIVNNSFIR